MLNESRVLSAEAAFYSWTTSGAVALIPHSSFLLLLHTPHSPLYTHNSCKRCPCGAAQSLLSLSSPRSLLSPLVSCRRLLRHFLYVDEAREAGGRRIQLVTPTLTSHTTAA